MITMSNKLCERTDKYGAYNVLVKTVKADSREIYYLLDNRR